MSTTCFDHLDSVYNLRQMMTLSHWSSVHFEEDRQKTEIYGVCVTTVTSK